MDGKIIIISAPSGCGKSTIIQALMADDDRRRRIRFSVSATNRQPRPGEVDGQSYHFMTTEAFRAAIAEEAFVEYEEVYPGRYYGTLKSEIDRSLQQGCAVLLDIDVAGGMRVKEMYGDRAVSIFIEPPSVDELRRRLVKRATDSAEAIDERVSKAAYEIGFAPRYDCRVVNDRLDEAVSAVGAIIDSAIGR